MFGAAQQSHVRAGGPRVAVGGASARGLTWLMLLVVQCNACFPGFCRRTANRPAGGVLGASPPAAAEQKVRLKCSDAI